MNFTTDIGFARSGAGNPHRLRAELFQTLNDSGGAANEIELTCF